MKQISTKTKTQLFQCKPAVGGERAFLGLTGVLRVCLTEMMTDAELGLRGYFYTGFGLVVEIHQNMGCYTAMQKCYSAEFRRMRSIEPAKRFIEFFDQNSEASVTSLSDEALRAEYGSTGTREELGYGGLMIPYSVRNVTNKPSSTGRRQQLRQGRIRIGFECCRSNGERVLLVLLRLLKTIEDYLQESEVKFAYDFNHEGLRKIKGLDAVMDDYGFHEDLVGPAKSAKSG